MPVLNTYAMRSPLATVVLLASVLAPSSAPALLGEVEVTASITDHQASYLDLAGKRPALFAYTGRTEATSPFPMEVTEDVLSQAARLEREEMIPDALAGTDLSWIAAGRAAPVKLDAQPMLPLVVLSPARANPYAENWFQRQEVARDLWHWGGVLAGSRLSGTSVSENAVAGIGLQPASYPSASVDGTGELSWVDRHIVRTATGVDHDPVTGEEFEGLFAMNLAMPSLRMEGGGKVFEKDQQVDLVLRLPARPSGLVIFQTPPAPPGVTLELSRSFDFTARTLTLSATVRAGSVWPGSGVDANDPSLPTWEWRPWVLFPGWEYGSTINGGPGAWFQHDGRSSLEIRELDADGMPVMPSGLFDLDLPAGSVLETAWGDRARVSMPITSPMARVSPNPLRGEAATSAIEIDGVTSLAVADEVERGTLSLPSVEIDGIVSPLNGATRRDRWISGSGTDGVSIVEIHESRGVFLSTILVAELRYGWIAYYLWDAHSIDGSDHDVKLRTLWDSSLGGEEGDTFLEPFYTQAPYPHEMAVPQGILDIPVGAVLNGWIGSLPAVEMSDDGHSVRHLQLYPNQPNTSISALETMGYLIADPGHVPADPEAEIADREGLTETDLLFVLVNGYRGRIWDRAAIPFTSLMLLL